MRRLNEGSHTAGSDISVGSVRSVRPGIPAKTEVESDDPFHAVAMQLPSPPGFDAMGEMARCMVEEFAMMGFSAPLLLKMFKNPFYQALHRVYEARGEEYVDTLLRGVFGDARSVVSDGSVRSDRPTRLSQAPSQSRKGVANA